MKERILLHLFDYSRLTEAYEAPPETTQAGIANAVRIRVSHVPQNMRPLQSEGLVEERLSHTKGQGSRRKVYSLTEKGRHRVADLRASLLKEDVPFKASTGEITSLPLMKVYHEERRGSSLLQLLEEANSMGAVAQVLEVEVTPVVDFTLEAPNVTRFFGRSSELEAVLRGVDETPIVVVLGFAGIGKTTLGAKVCETLRGSRPLFWRQVRPWDTAMDLATRVAMFLKALGRTGLHNLFSVSEARDLSRIEELLAQDLAGLRAVLIFDDVHHASEDAGAFLTLLARGLQVQRGSSAVFLSRTAPRFYSQREVVLQGSVMALTLGGLDKKSCAALLTDAGVPVALINRLTEASGGSPLFLQLFVARGARGGTVDGWDTVATYIAEQIEPFLDDGERDCLEAASFYDIPVPAQGLLLDGRGGTRSLVALQRKGLLGSVGKGQYVLHDTLKEYFQQSLVAERKKALNTKVVAWLLECADRAAERGNPSEAVAYLGNAAKRESDRTQLASIMERIGDMRLLLNQWALAEHAFRSALQEATEPRAGARLHWKLGWALEYSVGRLEEADRELDAGLALLREDPTPEAALLWTRKSAIAVYNRAFERGEEAARRASEIADQLPSDDMVRGRVALARARLRLSDTKRFDLAAIVADCRTAIDAFKKGRNEWVQGVAYSGLGEALVRAARIDEALSAFDEGAALSGLGGGLSNQVTLIAAQANLLVEYVGDFEGANTLLQKKHRLAKEHGLIWDFLLTYLEYANLLRRQRRYEEARESLEYFLHMTSEGELYIKSIKDTSRQGGRIADLALMARLCVRCGDAESAEVYLHQADELARGWPPETFAFDLAWAEAALRAEKREDAEAKAGYRLALKWPPLFTVLNMNHEDEPRAECMLDFGRFLASRGEKGEAHEVLNSALAILTSRSMKPLEREAGEVLKSLGP